MQTLVRSCDYCSSSFFPCCRRCCCQSKDPKIDMGWGVACYSIAIKTVQFAYAHFFYKSLLSMQNQTDSCLCKNDLISKFYLKLCNRNRNASALP